MNVKPKNWIFIEAQKNKSDAAFGWVKHLGIKYLFKQIPKESDGIFLKMPLWNIGVSNTCCERLCFIDSDVYFENTDWLNNVNEAFEKSYDIIQLHSYAKQEGKNDVVESIGHAIMEHRLKTGEDLGFKFGHGGYTLGMTRNAYDMIGRFDAASCLDDQWFWIKILGKKTGFNKYFILPYDPTNFYEDGYPVKIGSTDLICTHVSHTQTNYDAYNDASYGHVKPMEEICYDQNHEIPIWAKNQYGKIMKKCFKDIRDRNYNHMSYYDNYCDICGKIDDEHPLIIVTIWKRDYTHKTCDCVLKHKQMFEQHCRNDFIYVCICEYAETIYDVDCIPYKFDNKLKLTSDVIEKIVFNKKIQYPSRSTILYSNIDDIIDYDFNVLFDKERKFITLNTLYAFY